ncbi:MAG: GatB/YqeY domain-containing protein [Acetobacterales bacterium]
MSEKTMRERLQESLKDAVKSRRPVDTATLRLILAALKDRDIAARSKGNQEGIPDSEVMQMLAGMVKQREESITLYEQGGRLELAEEERLEIEVIRRFLPEPMSAAEMEKAVDEVLMDERAASLKDMGRVMAALRTGYAGRMDFGAASAIVKQRLG